MSATPITDAVYPPDIIDREYAAQGDSWGWGTLIKMRNTSRKLEMERDELIKALKSIMEIAHRYCSHGNELGGKYNDTELAKAEALISKIEQESK